MEVLRKILSKESWNRVKVPWSHSQLSQKASQPPPKSLRRPYISQNLTPRERLKSLLKSREEVKPPIWELSERQNGLWIKVNPENLSIDHSQKKHKSERLNKVLFRKIKSTHREKTKKWNSKNYPKSINSTNWKGSQPIIPFLSSKSMSESLNKFGFSKVTQSAPRKNIPR